MKKSKFRNIVTILSLLFFISSGVLSMNSVFTCCSDACCITDCCTSEKNAAPCKSSLSSENNCCNIVEGIQSEPESSVVYVSPSKVNTSMIFSHTDNYSARSTVQFYPQEYSSNPPIVYSSITVLRI